MAKIYEILPQPEEGWKRFDDTDSNIIYNGTWNHNKEPAHYNKSTTYTDVIGNYYKFYFYGSKLRLITGYHYNEGICTLNIDGIDYEVNSYQTGAQYCTLTFEKLDLKKGVHIVTGTLNKKNNPGKNYIELDAIDIDEDGYLLTEEEYNQYIKEQNKNDISINKTLKANLPSSTTKDIEIHFTEDGEMYINKQDGSFIKVNSSYKTYSSEETYNINDYVVYNNKLYKCIENITVAEDFNESKWQIVLEGEKGDPGEKGQDAANISKLYCKDNSLYIDFDNGTTKQVENFNIDTSETYTDENVNTEIDNILNKY